MNISFTPWSPAELRATAAFMLSIAALREAEPNGTPIDPVDPPDAPAETAPSKPTRTRAKKTEPAAATEPADAGEAQASASAQSAEVPASTTNEAAPASGATHDSIRLLFATAVQKGMREQAIPLFKTRGFNGISEITPDKLDEIEVELKALVNG